MAEVKRDQNRFMPTQVQFWHVAAYEVSFLVTLKHHPGLGLKFNLTVCCTVYMVAVEAARLADTGLPSAALSGCWRISIKAQYLDARKGSDVTAATPVWLLHLASACGFSVHLRLCGETRPNQNVPRWRWRPANADAAHGCWPWQSLVLLSANVTQSSTKSFCFGWLKVIFSRTAAPLKLQSGPILQYPTGGGVHYPTHLSWATFQSSLDLRTSSLLKGFMLPDQPHKLLETFHGFSKLLQHPGVFESLKRSSMTVKIKSSNNTHQQSDMRRNEWAPNYIIVIQVWFDVFRTASCCCCYCF